MLVFVRQMTFSSWRWSTWYPKCPIDACCGSLFLETNERRGELSIGIFTAPDKFPFNNAVCNEFAEWINTWNVSFMTDNFGSGNEQFIARTAVAADASVGHRVCTKFRVQDEGEMGMPGGFIVFALVENVSELAIHVSGGTLNTIREDICGELVPVIDCHGRRAANWELWCTGGNSNCPTLLYFELERIDWEHNSEHNVKSIMQTRVRVVSSMIDFGDDIHGESDDFYELGVATIQTHRGHTPKVWLHLVRINNLSGECAGICAGTCISTNAQSDPYIFLDSATEHQQGHGTADDSNDHCQLIPTKDTTKPQEVLQERTRGKGNNGQGKKGNGKKGKSEPNRNKSWMQSTATAKRQGPGGNQQRLRKRNEQKGQWQEGQERAKPQLRRGRRH